MGAAFSTINHCNPILHEPGSSRFLISPKQVVDPLERELCYLGIERLHDTCIDKVEDCGDNVHLVSNVA